MSDGQTDTRDVEESSGSLGRPPLTIELGGVYRTRDGRHVAIDSYTPGRFFNGVEFPFWGSVPGYTVASFMRSGVYDPGEATDLDLVEEVAAPPAGGTKNDSEKPDLSLLAYLPADFIVATGAALEYGARKYGVDNYLQGLSVRRLIAAMLRHANAYGRGEDLDLESGLSHLGHAAACVAMIFGCARAGTLEDNRVRTRLAALDGTKEAG